jgi:phosphoribosylformylglycinamidine synthase subunit PurQ / glutaminase
MRVGVVVFPGSNCDAETVGLIEHMGFEAERLWHKDPLPKLDMYILPGGFSYGDYMRSGALATYSPAMKYIKDYAADGRMVLGICNGFQILCESHILPGTLSRNDDNQFICQDVMIKNLVQQHYFIPIANKDGKYYCEHEVNIAYKYAYLFKGLETEIAGVYNDKGNVLGMMPHPERAYQPFHCSDNGTQIISNFIEKNS